MDKTREGGEDRREMAEKLTWPVPRAGYFEGFLSSALGLLRSFPSLNPGQEIWFGDGRVCGGEEDSITVVQGVVDVRPLV